MNEFATKCSNIILCGLITEMCFLSSYFIFILVLNFANGKSFKYFTNFKFEHVVFGKENLIKDYITLANDPNGNLSDKYTICSSMFIKFATTEQTVFQILKEDKTPWYKLEISTNSRNYDSLSETVSLWYENPRTGNLQQDFFSNAHIPIVPHSWYHICMGLDTVSGLVRIVLNGREVANEEKENFRNTISWKPKSLEGRIILFKGYSSGFWVQDRSKTSNFNIFNSMMSMDDMLSRTLGGDNCSTPGDYVRC